METTDGDSKQKNSNDLPNSGDLDESIRVRCGICDHSELDGGLLDYNFNFLLPFGTVLWVIFLLL